MWFGAFCQQVMRRTWTSRCVGPMDLIKVSCDFMKPPIHAMDRSIGCTAVITSGGRQSTPHRLRWIAGGETQGERGEGKGSCRLDWDGFAARRLDQNYRSDNEKNCTAGCIGWDGLGVSLSLKRLPPSAP
jgi:hypothetical protein